LQNHHGPRLIVPAPDNPQKVTGEKTVETYFSAQFSLRRNQPSCDDIGYHRGPLDEVEPIYHLIGTRLVRQTHGIELAVMCLYSTNGLRKPQTDAAMHWS
jgi:hypothetical protein